MLAALPLAFAAVHVPPTIVAPATAIHAHSIDSTANDNSHFQVRVDTAPFATGARPTLVYSGGRLTNPGTSVDPTGSSLWFDVDRPTALALAADWGTPLHERAPLDVGMRYAWRFPDHVAPGAPATVTLVATNTGATSIGFMIGGRQRGPRDNRFSFTVTRDGSVLPIIDAPDFGGIGYYKQLAPGQRAEVSVDLRSWVALDRPGHYAITATHETELATGGTMSPTQADLWAVAPRGQGAIVVR